MKARISTVTVCRKPGTDRTAGLLRIGNRVFRCRLGRSAITALKREGDGATPAGTWALLFGYFRADRLRLPVTRMPLQAIRKQDGWCDAPDHPCYNRLVRLPFDASHEVMRREDSLYDICIVMDHNITWRIRNRGSAIFLHLIDGRPHTAGCVALARRDMLRILPLLRPGTHIRILP